AGLIAVLAAVAAVGAVQVASYGSLSHTTHVSWWMLAAGFIGTELFVCHVDVRRDTYSISMMEVPLVVGLFFATPGALLVGRLVGSAVAMTVLRRRAGLKVVFNVALYAAETVLAIVVFRAAGQLSSVTQPASWLAAFVAVLAANVLSLGGVMLAMRLHGAVLEGRVRAMLVGALVPPIANTSLALGAAMLLWEEPRSAWLLGAIALVLAGAYRGYASLRHRYANLQHLYDFPTRLQASDSETVILDMLDATRELMRAERARLVVFRQDHSARVWSTDGTGATDSVVFVDELDVVTARVCDLRRPLRIAATTRDGEPRALLTAMGMRDCLCVPIITDDTVVAVMTVADRADDVSTFDADDLRLFQALVNHASIALDNAQLVHRLRHDALHDALTSLPNRTLFTTTIEQAIRYRQPGAKLAVVLMDLDRFKEVNDTLGHHFGDDLLAKVGSRLRDTLGERGAIARLAGDEFALLLSGLETADEAITLVRTIREAFDAPFELGALHVDVSGTFGIALSPDHGEDAATLLQRADVAMYEAKAGSGIALYTSDRDHYSPRRLALVGELREAIDRDELELHYQPKIDVATGTVLGAEALLRWPHPERGAIPPDEFVPIAEHTGVIRPLTLHVLRRAAADCARWTAAGHQVGVAVNVSARNLVDVDLVDRLPALLAATQLRPSQLTLEITESSIMSDPSRTLEVLDTLTRIGVRISIDDFGTGYSSLTYLKQLPVDEVKIDRSFVQALTSDKGDAAIVRSVIDLGTNLGMTVVAEGIESAAVLDALHAMSCPIAQGYHISKPLPLDGFLPWLAINEPRSHVVPMRRRHHPRHAAIS